MVHVLDIEEIYIYIFLQYFKKTSLCHDSVNIYQNQHVELTLRLCFVHHIYIYVRNMHIEVIKLPLLFIILLFYIHLLYGMYLLTAAVCYAQTCIFYIIY